MRSSNRIIRGLDAAELPNWSVELIGSRYENPVDRMMAEINRHQTEISAPPPAHRRGTAFERMGAGTGPARETAGRT
jgi:hypothetical protein